MKRYLLLITPLILIFTMVLSSCSLEEMSRDSELNAAAETTYDELSSTFSGESGQFSLVTEYLKSWAHKNEMDVAENQDHYMVLTNPATAVKAASPQSSSALSGPTISTIPCSPSP